MNDAFKCALWALWAILPANATDLAVLRNGNSIRHERRESVGQITRLYLGASDSDYVEIPSDEIDHFETEETPIPSQAASTGKVDGMGAADPGSSSLKGDGLQWVINGAGERHQVDPDFINSVIRAESGFNSHAVSPKGAQGLMQLMPKTASQLGVANAFDQHANVEGGTKYLRELLEKYNFDVPKALAAYNAGPKRVDYYRGVPPYYETRAYVAKVIRDFNRQKLAENPALGHKPSGSKHPALSSKALVRQSRKTKTPATERLPAGAGAVSR